MTRGEKIKNTLLGITKGGVGGALSGLFAGGPIGALVGAGLGATGGGLSTAGSGLSDQAIVKRQRKIAELEKMGSNISNRQANKLEKYRNTLQSQERNFPNSTLTEKMRSNYYGDQGLPEGLSRISKFSPEQNQLLDRLMQMGGEGIMGQNKYSFDDIRRAEMDRWNNETLPRLQEMYGGMQNSSAFNDALAQAQQRSAFRMGQLGYEDQIKQRDFMKQLMELGLAGRFDLHERMPEQSMGRTLFNSIASPEFLGTALKLYSGGGMGGNGMNSGGMGNSGNQGGAGWGRNISDFIKGGGMYGYLRS